MKSGWKEVLEIVRSDFHCFIDIEEADQILEVLEQQELLLYTFFLSEQNMSAVRINSLSKRADIEKKKYYEKKSLISELFSSFRTEDISVILIKGIALNNMLYNNMPVRIGGDIDLLVRKQDVPFVHKILMNQNWRQRIGPSSIGTSPKETTQAHRAFYATKQKMIEENMQMPVKRSFRKPEYLPYVKKGFPTIELHDGIYFMDEILIDEMINRFEESDAMLDMDGWNSFKAEDTFFLLVAGCYENSESFPANTFDYSLRLRDYVDLKFFVERFQEEMDWDKIEQRILRYDMDEMVGIVLNNLDIVYGKKMFPNLLPRIVRLESRWQMDLLSRMMFQRERLQQVLFIQRKQWLNEARANEGEGRLDYRAFYHSLADNRQVAVEATCLGEGVEIKWYIEKNNVRNLNKHLFQFVIIPLEGDISWFAYKMMVFMEGGIWQAYGHRTGRLTYGTIKKKTGTQFMVNIMEASDNICLRVRVLRSEYRDNMKLEEMVCIKAGIFQHVYQDIFDNSSDSEKVWLMKI